MKISLNLLGTFAIHSPKGIPLSLPTRKSCALMAYLAVNADRPQPRERLISLLWSDRRENQARKSLTHALQSIRKLDRSGERPILDSDGEKATLCGDRMEIDFLRFRELLAEHPSEALALYEGPFLDGLAIPESPIEDWLAATRSELHDLACDAQQRVAGAAADAGDIDRAIDAANRLVQLDPMRERSHQLLIRLLYESGDRAMALRQYQACEDILKRELGVEPGPVTKALFGTIRSDETVARVVASPALTTVEHPNAWTAIPVTASKTRRPLLIVLGVAAAFVLVATASIIALYPRYWARADRLSNIEASGSVTLAPIERKTFESATERDAWYAGARNAVESIYDRRLTAMKTDWHSRNCGAVTAPNGRTFCRDIGYQIQLLLQQKATELDALKREYAQASVLPDAHAAPEKPPVAENELQDTADSRKTGTTAVKDPASAKGAPNSGAADPASRESIQREVRSDYAEKRNEPLPDAERVATLPNERQRSAANEAGNHAVAPLARKSAIAAIGTHRATRREPVAGKTHAEAEVVLAPMPGRKPSPPRLDSSEKSSKNYSNPNRTSTVATVRTFAGADSKPLSNSKQRQRDIVATAPSLSHAKVNFEKDRDKIELAIGDYYFMTKDGQPGNFWGSYVEEFTEFTVKRVYGDQIDLLAEYETSSVNGRVTMNETKSGRFLLRKANGTYTVIKMWDGKERGGEKVFGASSSQPALTVDYEEDRKAIRQAIIDFYDITGYTKDFPDSFNGAWFDEIRSISVRNVSGNRIQVDVSYIAVGIYSNTVRSLKGRFTLTKSKSSYRVVAFSPSVGPMAKPSHMKLNTKEDRKEIAQTTGGDYF